MMLAPGIGVSFAIAGMTSARGRSHTFDARADGYARGEACGGVALCGGGHDGTVLGLLGSAARQDGRSASLSAPNGPAQQGLLVAAVYGCLGLGVTRTPPEPALRRAYAAAVDAAALGDVVYAIGGHNAPLPAPLGGDFGSTVEAYDAAEDRWSTTLDSRTTLRPTRMLKHRRSHRDAGF